jgi:hypothetical protein
MLTSEYWFLDGSLASLHPSQVRFLTFSVN